MAQLWTCVIRIFRLLKKSCMWKGVEGLGCERSNRQANMMKGHTLVEKNKLINFDWYSMKKFILNSTTFVWVDQSFQNYHGVHNLVEGFLRVP
jgi:hypothetical protein